MRGINLHPSVKKKQQMNVTSNAAFLLFDYMLLFTFPI